MIVLRQIETHLRLVKKALLFAGEIVFMFLGVVFSLIAGVYPGMFDARLGFLAFLVSFSLICGALIWFHRKTGNWFIAADAAAWLAHRSRQQLHHGQSKYIHTALRSLLWLPSLLAAFVLVFFPVASHLVFSGTNAGSHYRMTAPLNWLILRGTDSSVFMAFFSEKGLSHYGFTPVWFNHKMPSVAEFFVSSPDDAPEWYRPKHERATRHFTHGAVRQFQLGTITATCFECQHTYQDQASHHSIFSPPVLWESLCSTEKNGSDYNLRASFFGHREDLAAFYEALTTAKPTI